MICRSFWVASTSCHVTSIPLLYYRWAFWAFCLTTAVTPLTYLCSNCHSLIEFALASPDGPYFLF
jgi:hypothetical protein